MGKILTKENLIRFGILNAGTLIITIGVYFFKFPNDFSTGGVTGVSVVLTHYFPSLSASNFVTILNVALLILGFLVFGRGFGFMTAYSSLEMSFVLELLERFVPMDAPFTAEPLMELLFAGGLPAVGSAMLFEIDASNGGTDIVAMILKKYTSMDIGKALLYVDVLITAATLIVINIETGLYSLLGLVLKSVMVDMVIESFNRRKSFMLVTSCPDEVCTYITHQLHRSATYWKGEGAYSHQDKWVVLTALSRAQAVALRRYLKGIDPHAFMLITNSSEIFGKGFLRA